MEPQKLLRNPGDIPLPIHTSKDTFKRIKTNKQTNKQKILANPFILGHSAPLVFADGEYQLHFHSLFTHPETLIKINGLS